MGLWVMCAHSLGYGFARAMFWAITELDGQLGLAKVFMMVDSPRSARVIEDANFGLDGFN